MFGWAKRRRALKLSTERMRHDAMNEKRRPIVAALSAIGANVQSGEKESFAAESAAKVTRHLCQANNVDMSEEHSLYVAGIFTMVAADQLARSVGARFGTSASLALARLVPGNSDLGGSYDTVIDGFYRLTANKPEVVERIRESLAQWVAQPNPGNVDRLKASFDMLHRSIGTRHRTAGEP